jgi:hypothetical protein
VDVIREQCVILRKRASGQFQLLELLLPDCSHKLLAAFVYPETTELLVFKVCSGFTDKKLRYPPEAQLLEQERAARCEEFDARRKEARVRIEKAARFIHLQRPFQICLFIQNVALNSSISSFNW